MTTEASLIVLREIFLDPDAHLERASKQPKQFSATKRQPT
jgi:hypothetical protein